MSSVAPSLLEMHRRPTNALQQLRPGRYRDGWMEFVPHRCAWRRADTCQRQTLLRVQGQPLLTACRRDMVLISRAGVERRNCSDTCVEAISKARAATRSGLNPSFELHPAANSTPRVIPYLWAFWMLTVLGRRPRSRYPSPSRRPP